MFLDILLFGMVFELVTSKCHVTFLRSITLSSLYNAVAELGSALDILFLHFSKNDHKFSSAVEAGLLQLSLTHKFYLFLHNFIQFKL